MQNCGLSIAQHQYDNQEPPRYNCKPVCNCYYCGAEIYNGERYAVVAGLFNYCKDCVDFVVAREGEQ